jgi:hypothetical protein
MNAYCPECETELDASSGICPACRRDPRASIAPAARPAPVREMSLTERYRGTDYDIRVQHIAADANDTRGRMFVLVGLAAAAGLSAVAMSALGVL